IAVAAWQANARRRGMPEADGRGRSSGARDGVKTAGTEGRHGAVVGWSGQKNVSDFRAELRLEPRQAEARHNVLWPTDTLACIRERCPWPGRKRRKPRRRRREGPCVPSQDRRKGNGATRENWRSVVFHQSPRL